MPGPAERDALAPVPPRTARRGRRGDPPPAPWGRFPLVELCTLLALVIGVLGFLKGGRSGVVMLICAGTLGSLAGLELSVREHLAGYRPHSTILAATVGLLALAILFLAQVPRLVLLPVAAAAFGTAFWVLRGVYRRRAEGLSGR